jgi:hypothetical protein
METEIHVVMMKIIEEQKFATVLSALSNVQALLVIIFFR